MSILTEKETKGQLALLATENNIRKAVIGIRDFHFEVGADFAKIRDGKLWKHAGCSSWNDYCKSGRLDCSRQHAERLIAAAKIKPYIAELTDSCTQGAIWTERSVRELTHLVTGKVEGTDYRFGVKVIRRTSEKVVKRVEAGEPLTAKLVKEIVDDDRGVSRKRLDRLVEKNKRSTEEFDKKYGPKPIDDIVTRQAAKLQVELDGLKELIPETWLDVSPETFEIIDKVLSETRDFFKSKKPKPNRPYNGAVENLRIVGPSENGSAE